MSKASLPPSWTGSVLHASFIVTTASSTHLLLAGAGRIPYLTGWPGSPLLLARPCGQAKKAPACLLPRPRPPATAAVPGQDAGVQSSLSMLSQHQHQALNCSFETP